jgi:hypothetical protein
MRKLNLIITDRMARLLEAITDFRNVTVTGWDITQDSVYISFFDDSMRAGMPVVYHRYHGDFHKLLHELEDYA